MTDEKAMTFDQELQNTLRESQPPTPARSRLEGARSGRPWLNHAPSLANSFAKLYKSSDPAVAARAPADVEA